MFYHFINRRRKFEILYLFIERGEKLRYHKCSEQRKIEIISHFLNRERSEREEELKNVAIFSRVATEKEILRDFTMFSIASAASEKKNEVFYPFPQL